MKKQLLLLLTAGALLPLAGSNGRFTPKPVSPRSITVSQKSDTALIRNGKALMAVYVPAGVPQAIHNAAKEFASLLSEIAGKKNSVQVFTKYPSTFKGIVFCLGDKQLAAQLKVKLNSIDRDGYLIKSAGNRILISGNDTLFGSDQGTLYGCYEFLERFGGVRFYFPGKYGTLIPQKKNWSVPQITLYDRPDSQYRVIYWPAPGGLKPVWHDPETEKNWKSELWRHELRVRRSTLALPNCHGLAQLGYVKRFAKTHPEYFSLKPDGQRADGSVVRVPSDAKGHLCFSSGIMEEIYQDAKAVLTGPEAIKKRNMKGYSIWAHAKPFFNLMPNDCMGRCRCAKCIPHFEGLSEGGGYSDKAAAFLWSKLLTIPKRLQKEGIPGYITMMAYDLNRFPPKEEMPSNVVMQIAVNGPWSKGRPAEKEELALVQKWVKVYGGNKIYMWNYPTKCAVKELPLIPNHTPLCIGEYYKKMAKYSFGTMLNATADHWFFGHMNFYVFSKVMWDNNVDLNALMKEYYQRMFGKGAAAMEEVSKIIENHWLKNICGNVVNTSYGPMTYPPDEIKLWNTIFNAEEMARINGIFDRAEKAAAGDKAALERVRFWRKAMWEPTVEGRNRYFGNGELVKRFSHPMISLKPGEKLNWNNVPKAGLVPIKSDIAEVRTFVQMRCDKENFYFRFECEEPFTDMMNSVRRKPGDREVWRDNNIEIHLDTEAKRATSYQIIINDLGSVADLRNTPGKLGFDYSWNSGAKVNITVNKKKNWIATVTVPRKNLPQVKDGKLLVNFARFRELGKKRVHALYTWSPFAKTFNDLNNFGTAVIDPGPSKNLVTDPDFAVTGLYKAQGTLWSSSASRDTKIFRTAGVSMRFEGKKNALVHRVKLKPDTRYRLSFLLKMDNVSLLPGFKVTNGGFYVRIDEGNKAHYFPDRAYYGSIPWLYKEHIWRTDKKIGTKYNPYIHFTLRNSSGKAWVDHVELTELPDK